MKSYLVKPGSGIENMQLSETEKPTLQPGKLLLKMLAWSLNYRDLLVAGGQYGIGLPSPLIPISDGVGEIIESNTELNGFKIGQRVALSFFPDWNDSLSKNRIAVVFVGSHSTRHARPSAFRRHPAAPDRLAPEPLMNAFATLPGRVGLGLFFVLFGLLVQNAEGGAR